MACAYARNAWRKRKGRLYWALIKNEIYRKAGQINLLFFDSHWPDLCGLPAFHVPGWDCGRFNMTSAQSQEICECGLPEYAHGKDGKAFELKKVADGTQVTLICKKFVPKIVVESISGKDLTKDRRYLKKIKDFKPVQSQKKETTKDNTFHLEGTSSSDAPVPHDTAVHVGSEEQLRVCGKIGRMRWKGDEIKMIKCGRYCPACKIIHLCPSCQPKEQKK